MTRLGIDPALMHSLALALVAVTVAGYALAAFTSLGLLPTFIWSPAIAVGSMASLGLLAACFQPWLLLGVVIDLALLWSSLVEGWLPAVDGSGI